MVIDKYKGCLFGLAIGDAIGTSVEFKPRGSFAPVTDMVGGGVFDLKPGQWTDDTSMALCLGQSLLDCSGFNAHDQMDKYLKWRDNGYMSSNGRCFDIGNTISTALDIYENTGDCYAGLTDVYSAGNGSIMRLAPIPMFFLHTENMLQYAAMSSAITHKHPDCVSACILLAHILKELFLGMDKYHAITLPVKSNLSKHIADIVVNQTYLSDDVIKGSGHVVKSLEAALWAFNKGRSFKECVLLAVNLGDDADTTGAITGQLAGAYYGFDAIPIDWKNNIALHNVLLNMSINLYKKAIL